ncbi:MAG: 3'-5' exonuclease [Arcobacteraceae bacterium]
MINYIKQYFNKKKLTDPKYEYLFDKYEGDELVCFDCETTGLNPKLDDIISIGAVTIKGDKIDLHNKFERFVKPKNAAMISDAIKIHHIREVDLIHAEDIDDVIEEFLDFVGNRPLVGYYLSFDIAMVNKYIKPKIGITLPNKANEVSSIYYDKVSKYHSVDIDLKFKTIMNNLNLPFMKAHDATNDAIMTALIYIKLNNINTINIKKHY